MQTVLEQKRIEYSQALDVALAKILTCLTNMPEVEQIILFGSYVTGRRDLFTDIDLLVVMSSEKDFVTRTAELYQRIQVDVDMDLLVYIPKEFERQKQQGFVRQALATGKVLYEKQRPLRGMGPPVTEPG